jgi:hypothetical protein
MTAVKGRVASARMLKSLKAKGKVLQRATKGVKVPSLRKYSGGRRSKYE